MLLLCCLLAYFDNASANPLSRPFGMYEKGANSCRFDFGIQQRVYFRSFCLISSVQGFALAPASTSNNLVFYLGNVVRTIINELGIHTENIYQGTLNL